MKIFRITFAILVIALLHASCSKDFLNVENESELSATSFYKTQDDFEKLLLTCYMPMAFSNLYGSSIHVLDWAFDDRVLHEQINVQNLQIDATNGQVADIWYGIYTGIFRCNLFFEKFTPEIPADETRKTQMFGEAHFLRGLYYFWAGLYFEVPPLLRNSYVPNTLYPNSTQDSIYNFAEEELQLAITQLSATNTFKWDVDNVGRTTAGAAMAFLGKTYLYRQKWQQAADMFRQVMDLGIYDLNMPRGTDSLDYVFAYLSNFSFMDLPAGNGRVYDSENNIESIFEVQFSTAYVEDDRAGRYLPGRRGTGSFLTWFNGLGFTGGYKNIAIDDSKFPQQFERPASHPAGLAIDPRFYAIYWRIGDSLDFRTNSPLYGQVLKASDLNSSLGTTTGLRKYFYPPHIQPFYYLAPFMDPDNWRLMRYADVLLMYAEAKYRATNNAGDAEALAAFNHVRERAGLQPITTLSKEAIIHERDIEFAAEHIRYWDLVRWYQNGWLSLTDIRVYKPYFQEKNVCLPIPLREINNMKGVLKQNPKWLN
jgi:hypothetical protein